MIKNTQIALAKQGQITEAMKYVAKIENVPVEKIRTAVAEGRVVIPANIHHDSLTYMGIGRELKTKINANIGTSSMSSCPNAELKKLATAIELGADTVMDLSTGENLETIRRNIIKNSTIPVGTVPIYEIACRARSENGLNLSEEIILQVIEEQAEQGVDYMTIHAGIRPTQLASARERKLKIVSRGGALIARYMSENKCENPFYSCFDKILKICAKHDVTLSLGDAMRPGCLADATDEAQLAELLELGKLARRCREADVQVMIEGPGHVPLDQIEMNMKLQQLWCDDAPFYILGPVVIDCAPGYDHITSAIGAAIGAWKGAAMLCYVTPKEHLGLPNDDDVRQGVIAYKIAAHAADIANHLPNARSRDDAMSDARANFDWEKQFELALDPVHARKLRNEALQERNESVEDHGAANDENFCSMCGPDLCSMRNSKEI